MLTQNDIRVLRKLSGELKQISLLPYQEEKKKFWYRHNCLKGERPAIFISPDYSWGELYAHAKLECETPLGRELEHQIWEKLLRHRYLPDDVPVIGEIRLAKAYTNTMWGLAPKIRHSGIAGGAWHHEPVIESASDWKKLKFPTVEYHERDTLMRYDVVNESLGDILPVRLRGVTNFSFHLLHWYADYRGLENLFSDLYDEPGMVKEQLCFFTEGLQHMLRQYDDLNLLSLNNDDTLHYTGGIGYTHELPADTFCGRVRFCDLWAAAEAQEFSCVSPEMHEEFILPYERKLLEIFGINGYGCCDDLSEKLDGILKIKNLRRVAVCPWSDISKFTPRLKRDYIMTWKPQPSHLAMEKFDEAAVEKELRDGLTKAKGGIIELILRDTHTCRNQPERFIRWTEIARKAIAEVWQ